MQNSQSPVKGGKKSKIRTMFRTFINDQLMLKNESSSIDLLFFKIFNINLTMYYVSFNHFKTTDSNIDCD